MSHVVACEELTGAVEKIRGWRYRRRRMPQEGLSRFGGDSPGALFVLSARGSAAPGKAPAVTDAPPGIPRSAPQRVQCREDPLWKLGLAATVPAPAVLRVRFG
jgi:hypothetical protein